jgi:hypothetical protein
MVTNQRQIHPVLGETPLEESGAVIEFWSVLLVE